MTTPPAPYTPAVPCAQWADLLAAPEQQLSPAERARLESHLTSCAACAAVRDEYRRMDSQIRALPAPRPLTGPPPALLHMWAREDVQRVAELPFYGASETSGERTQSVQRSPAASRRHRAAGPIGALAAVLILGALIGGYYAMLANHSAPGPQTSSATPSYGPPVDPPGPRASIGAWRTLALPPGAPDRAQQTAQPGAGTGAPTGGAQVYEQPAVAGLL
ncbi:MAG TPA: zf-HC2 domain-containing protein, partial [Ktedonobacterales bacterium]|nr:zf-HC2 domain-containing protein [Ktedonobacterales bacterium]